jgi:hypothetical protein
MSLEDTMAGMAERLGKPLPPKAARHSDPDMERAYEQADGIAESVLKAGRFNIDEVRAVLSEHGGDGISATLAVMRRHHADLFSAREPMVKGGKGNLTDVAVHRAGVRVWGELAAAGAARVDAAGVANGIAARAAIQRDTEPPTDVSAALARLRARDMATQLVALAKARPRLDAEEADKAERAATKAVQDAADAVVKADNPGTRRAYDAALQAYHLAAAKKRSARKALKEASQVEVDVEAFADALARSDGEHWGSNVRTRIEEVAELAKAMATVFTELRESLHLVEVARETANGMAERAGLDHRVPAPTPDLSAIERKFALAFHEGLGASGNAANAGRIVDAIRRR